MQRKFTGYTFNFAININLFFAILFIVLIYSGILNIIMNLCVILVPLIWQIFFNIREVYTTVKFTHRFWIKENTPAGTVVGQVIVLSDYGDATFQSSFTSLADKRLGEFFAISVTNGSITASKEVDREMICPQTGKESSNASKMQSPPLAHSDSPFCEIEFLVHVSVTGLEVKDSYLETVYLCILDSNDNFPLFDSSSVTIKVSESSPIDSRFHLPEASDADLGKNQISDYHLIQLNSENNQHSLQKCPSDTNNVFAYSDGNDFFTLDLVIEKDSKKIPMLHQIRKLDFEAVHHLNYCLYAYDGSRQNGSLFVSVELQDANDHVPAWIGLPYQVKIPECGHKQQATTWKTNLELRNFAHRHGFGYEAPIRFLIKLAASDKDSGTYGKVHYRTLASGKQKESSFFNQQSRTSSYKSFIYEDKLYLVGQLDFETTPRFSIPVEAIDGAGLTNFTEVEVFVEDCNDNSPQISIQSLSQLPKFNDSQFKMYHYLQASTKIWLEEEDESEYKLATVTVTDADSESNANLNCDTEWNHLDGVNPFLLIPLKSGSESLKVPSVYILSKRKGAKLDREIATRVQVTIICTDGGQPQANIVRNVVAIGILDINDNAPEFRSRLSSLAVMENKPSGTFSGIVQAVDSDFGYNSEISYNLSSCKTESDPIPFSIDSKTGRIYTTRQLDREIKSSFCVIITATDMGQPSLNSSQNITIIVLDANDSPPLFENNRNESGRIIFELHETFENERFVDKLIGQINATDADLGQNSSLEFILKSTAPYWRSRQANFRINRKGQLVVDGILDREKNSEYELTVVVTDLAPMNHRLTSEIGVRVHLMDVNDNPPVFLLPPYVLKDASSSASITDVINITLMTPVNSSIYQLCASDSDIEENAQLNFTLRCAKYLQDYFALGELHVSTSENGLNKTCVDIMLTKSLNEMLSTKLNIDDVHKRIRLPVEHQLYVTVSDSGLRKFTKTARIKIHIKKEEKTVFENPNSNIVAKKALDKFPQSDLKHSWYHQPNLKQVAVAPTPKTANILHSGTKSPSVDKANNSFFHRQSKAKYLFIVAVVIFILFIAVLGLLAFMFLRDFASKNRPTEHPVGPTPNEFPDSHLNAITFAPEYRDGSMSMKKFKFTSNRDLNNVSSSGHTLPHSLSQFPCDDGTNSCLLDSRQRAMDLIDYKLDKETSLDKDIPQQATGDSKIAMSFCLNRNYIVKSPNCIQTEPPLGKYNPSQIYTQLKPKTNLAVEKQGANQLTMLMTLPYQVDEQNVSKGVIVKPEMQRQHTPEGDYFIPATFVFADASYTQLTPSPTATHAHSMKRSGPATRITPTSNSLEVNEI